MFRKQQTPVLEKFLGINGSSRFAQFCSFCIDLTINLNFFEVKKDH